MKMPQAPNLVKVEIPDTQSIPNMPAQYADHSHEMVKKVNSITNYEPPKIKLTYETVEKEIITTEKTTKRIINKTFDSNREANDFIRENPDCKIIKVEEVDQDVR